MRPQAGLRSSFCYKHCTSICIWDRQNGNQRKSVKPAVSVYYGMSMPVNYTPQGITFHLTNGGQERLLIVATFWCLSLFQWMAKLWPEGPFMKVGRLILAAILRMKCNLNCNSVSSRILMGLSESVLLFSLPSYTLDLFLQMLATLWAVSGLFLAQLSHFPTSHLPWCPLKGKNRSATSIACFTCSEVSQSLVETRATRQCSPPGDVALGCRESAAYPGHFPSSFPAGRKPSADPGEFCLHRKVSFFSVHAPGNPCSEALGTRGAVQEGEKHLPLTTECDPAPPK